MFLSKFLLCVFAALVGTAVAGPTRHGRRGVCPKKTTTIAVPGTTATVLATVSTSVAATSIAKSTSPTKVSTIVTTQTTRLATSKITSSKFDSSTQTSSSSAASPTSTGTISGLLGFLFPASTGKAFFTTCPASSVAKALTDAVFRPTNVLTSVPHTYANAPDGKRAMKAHYPKGSYTFGYSPQGGFSFYAPGPPEVNLTTAKEATFGYSVFFPQGFEYQLGGKIPGLYGGDSEEIATGCSGGRRDDRCFSVRLMWRSGGKGELYTYLPPSASANQKLCTVPPSSYCNPTYGASVGTGSFIFATGAWTTIAERVRLNDVGQANGQIELFVNGRSVINVGGLVLRTSSAGRLRGMQMHTFFGGSSPEFATPKDQDVFFSDFSVAITQKL